MMTLEELRDITEALESATTELTGQFGIKSARLVLQTPEGDREITVEWDAKRHTWKVSL